MKVNVSELQPYLDAAVHTPGLSIKSTQLMFYPYVDFITKAASMATACICRVVDGAGEHTVMLTLNRDSKGEELISIWCSDKYVEKRMTDSEADTRAREAAEASGMLGAQADPLIRKMKESYALYAESANCSFWTLWRKDKKLCSHTSAVLAMVRDSRPALLQELRDLYATASALPAVEIRGDTFSLSELLFRIPVLLEGDRGAGKTTTARALARDGSYGYVEAAGHQGMEACDLFGFLVPVAGHDGLIWKDGPLSKAFRMAQTRKTVLLIDELLRIPQRELSVLLTALSPDQGVYRLPTGRIVKVVDGVGEEEVLEVPVANLAVLATTNVGGEYAVDSLDPALAERFVIVRMDTEVGKLTSILAGLVKARGFSLALVSNLVEFFTKMNAAKTQGLVSEIPSTRTLARAVELAETEGDIVRALRTQVLLWVARDADGHPVQEQIDAVVKVLDTLFGATTAKKKK